ncbi:hypothetical protein L227DRAFT_573651 [Lentinus tigrinus ALCF2SS1-6]|uniref:Uncharacterized protein n=1 Tax=Lentinus tigrinus ALCF2SS1-6 TaxID=1328759 RepID=A0A5C2SFF6_9APHY|nr:hypothetical protein L227DRAFT_573651 [Lentinus tigrinus ALCF2SS1-6]
MYSDEEEDGSFVNDLALTALTPDQLDGSPGPPSDALSQTFSSSHSLQTSSHRQGQSFFQPSPTLDLPTGTTSPAPWLESHDLRSQALSPSVDEALEVTTSYFPIALDDDLACDLDEGMDSSRAFFTATPVLSPLLLDAVAEGSEVLEFEIDSEFDMSQAESLDGCSLSGCNLSSSPRSRLPPAQESALACVTAVFGKFHDDQEDEAAARLRTLAYPVSSADENPSARVPVIDGDGDGQVGQYDGENEGSLVAGDAGHATAIRARPGEEACAGVGAGARFLAEPAGMDLQWEVEELYFDEGGNEGDMLCFE